MHNNTNLQDLLHECKHLKLLYVEDDKALSKNMYNTLKEFFSVVSVAYDGEEGLALYENNDFDIVLTDIMMPHMDGREMTRRIREINADQAIIILSANEESSYLMELIEIGIHKFVQKPPSLKRLTDSLLNTAQNINNANKVAQLADETKHNLAESRELLRSIIDTVPVRIFWKDKDLNYLGCNKLFAKDAGFESQDQIIGKNDFELSWKDEAQGYVDDDRLVMEGGKDKVNYEEQQTQADGKTIWVTTSKTPLRGENSETIGILGSYVDITKQKEAMASIQKARDELGYQAEHDILTGLPNRTLYFDRLNQAIKKASRNSTKAAVIFMDLDRFKEINDSLGHDTGDKVVQLLGTRLQEELREEDTIARFGGDEFIILIESFTDIVNVTEIMQKLMESMERPFEINNHSLHLTLSAGISIYPDDGNKAEVIIRNADTAMYKAKDQGRNTYHFYTKEMTIESFSHMLMSKNIRLALKEKEFMVYYQPQIDAVSNKLLGMEALIRWKNAKGEYVSPADFIPIAEDTGLIDKIDQYVFSEATSQITQWYQQGYSPGRISINLSTVELQNKDFVQNIQTKMSQLNCNPQWVELEITEGYTMKYPDAAIKMLQDIKDLGVTLSIDDFGTGYSSLSYLKKLPIHKLKIDQSFVYDVPGSSNDEAIVESIISLAKTMNFEVIAEGVETLKQQDFLVEKGCHNMQGYFYARPMPADEMEEYLKKFI